MVQHSVNSVGSARMSPPSTITSQQTCRPSFCLKDRSGSGRVVIWCSSRAKMQSLQPWFCAGKIKWVEIQFLRKNIYKNEEIIHFITYAVFSSIQFNFLIEREDEDEAAKTGCPHNASLLRHYLSCIYWQFWLQYFGIKLMCICIIYIQGNWLRFWLTPKSLVGWYQTLTDWTG